MGNLIIGYGEIGKAVYQVVRQGDDTQILDKDQPQAFNDIDVMHICFPESDEFEKEVERYITEYRPKHIIIWSTVPIGTTKRFIGAVHSPVEGKHPDLELSIRTMERWIGANTLEDGQFFHDYFTERGLKTRVVTSSDYTEALKLLSTSEYGVNLVFADYKARVAENIGMPYELTQAWNEEYNKLYKALGMEKRFQKFVLTPPKGKIGGHCVTQNAKILYQQLPSELLFKIIAMEDV